MGEPQPLIDTECSDVLNQEGIRVLDDLVCTLVEVNAGGGFTEHGWTLIKDDILRARGLIRDSIGIRDRVLANPEFALLPRLEANLLAGVVVPVGVNDCGVRVGWNPETDPGFVVFSEADVRAAVVLRCVMYGFLLRGFEVWGVDLAPKGGHFIGVEDRCKFLVSDPTGLRHSEAAAGMIQAVVEEVGRREHAQNGPPRHIDAAAPLLVAVAGLQISLCSPEQVCQLELLATKGPTVGIHLLATTKNAATFGPLTQFMNARLLVGYHDRGRTPLDRMLFHPGSYDESWVRNSPQQPRPMLNPRGILDTALAVGGERIQVFTSDPWLIHADLAQLDP